MNEQLLTAEELAERLQVTRETVYEMARTEQVPAYRVGKTLLRFSWPEVLAALRIGSVTGELSVPNGAGEDASSEVA